MLCGIPEADWDQLAEFYLSMQVEADRIAYELPAVDPHKAQPQFRDELAGRFTPSTAEIILTMALLMYLAWQDMPFEKLARLGKREN